MAEPAAAVRATMVTGAAAAQRPMRTVLIFAHECAPYHRPESTVGAQRPAQFAKWLPEFGWRAVVLCCDDSRCGEGWTARDARAVREAIRVAEPGRSVVIATPSLAWDGVLDRAWQRVMRCVDRPGNSLVRKPLTFAKYFTGDYSQSWQPCARAAAAIVAEEMPIDVCIGEHSPDAGIFLARWFSRYHGVPWVADFRDPVLFGYSPHVRVIFEAFERRRLSSASHIINVTDYLSRLDDERFARPGSAIANGFDADEFSDPVPHRTETQFRIVYTGNVWPVGGLRIFLDGLARLCSVVGDGAWQRIRFVYRGLAARQVQDAAGAAGVTRLLDCAGFIPRVEALRLVRSAHLLLVFSTTGGEQRDRLWANGVRPGKVFEYLGARRPILCVPGDGGALDTLLAETRSGTIARNADEVASSLEHVLAQWERTGSVAPPDNADLITPYTRRAGAERLAKILDGVTDREVIARHERSLRGGPQGP